MNESDDVDEESNFYVNNLSVEYNLRGDVFINLQNISRRASGDGWKTVREHRRVTMNWRTARRLIRMLQDRLDRVEEYFGRLDDGELVRNMVETDWSEIVDDSSDGPDLEYMG